MKHAFTNPKSDGADATVVRPSDWNADHTVTVISPTSLAANVNDYAPAGIATADVVRQASSVDVTITGIVAPAAAKSLVLMNIGSFWITLEAVSASSSAANQLRPPGLDNYILAPGAAALLVYDMTTAMWRIVARHPYEFDGHKGDILRVNGQGYTGSNRSFIYAGSTGLVFGGDIEVGTSVAGILFQRSATTAMHNVQGNGVTPQHSGSRVGEGNYRYTLDETGIGWGTGTAAQDARLYRYAADTLGTDDMFRIVRPAAADATLYTHVGAESTDRFVLGADGKLSWGGGSSAVDTFLYRQPSVGLKTTSFFNIERPTNTTAIGTSVLADSAYRFLLWASGDLNWGSGAGTYDIRWRRTQAGRIVLDTNGAAAWTEFGLSGTAGNRVKIDARVSPDVNARFELYGDATMAGLAFGDGTAMPDTNLYRSGANALKTDDALEVAGGITVAGVPITTTGPAPTLQKFTANGTWTKPAGLAYIVVECQGAGGGGGGAAVTNASENASGSGGGAGAYARKMITAAALLNLTSNQANVLVGAGGTGVAGANGNAGANSSIAFPGTGITSVVGGGGPGGNVGPAGSGSALNSGPVGGVATGGDINCDGGIGESTGIFGGVRALTGTGGVAVLGGSGRPGNNNTGSTGGDYGGGGGGATSNISSAARAGGAGGPGVVLVWEYYAGIPPGGGYPTGGSGTSFPGGPAVDDRFYRTDLDMEFFWNGTYWLSTTLYRESMPHCGESASLLPLTVTAATAVDRWPVHGSSTPGTPPFDLWLDSVDVVTMVQTTNNTTNYWSYQLRAIGAATVAAVVSATTQNNQAINDNVSRNHAIGALMSSFVSNCDTLDVIVNNNAKVGTPGALRLYSAIRYRIVG